MKDQLMRHIEELGYSYDNKKVEAFVAGPMLELLAGEVEDGISTLDEVKRDIPKLISYEEV